MANDIRPRAPHSSKESIRSLNLFYDTSWTLYRCIWTPPATLRRDDLARRLTKQLKKSTTGDIDDDEVFREKSGSLLECEVEPISVHDGERLFWGLSVSVRYERVEHRFVIYGSEEGVRSLLLIKAPAVVAKKVLGFLGVALDVRVPEPLKLSQGLLQRQLEAFVGLGIEELEQEPATQLLAEVVRDIRITISFDAPVASKLRSMDVDVPAQTVRHLLSSALDEKMDFLSALAKYLRQHTGLMIPKDSSDTESPMTISKIVCGAFAISTDGRLKLMKKAVDAADAIDETLKGKVAGLNMDLLKVILDEAVED